MIRKLYQAVLVQCNRVSFFQTYTINLTLWVNNGDIIFFTQSVGYYVKYLNETDLSTFTTKMVTCDILLLK